MLKNNVAKVVDRSMKDPVFAQKFKANPDTMIEQLDCELEDSEKEVLASLDANEIRDEIAEKKAFYGISIAGIVF